MIEHWFLLLAVTAIVCAIFGLGGALVDRLDLDAIAERWRRR